MSPEDEFAEPAWPPFVSAGTSWRTVLEGLRETERLPGDRILEGQARQLVRLLRWAAGQSRFYQNGGWIDDVVADLDHTPDAFWDIWDRIPILTKPVLRTHGESLHSQSVPKDQIPIGSTRTSGSTGIVVEVRTTALTRTMWQVITLREHFWQRRDPSKRLGAIRYRKSDDRDPAGTPLPSWGPPVANLFRTGPASVIHVGHGIDTLAEWLIRFDPHYLIAYPSIVVPLLEQVGDAQSARALEEVRLFSEPLDPEVEGRLADRWGLRATDIYSANEVGNIAFRCERGTLHVQAESVFVEILDEQGRQCGPGETGRVVVTALHNLATPLIRYDIGDYATVGEPCGCGRGLPVIRQVRGRARNLVRTPDGRQSWPVDLAKIRNVAVIRQAQFVQTSIDTVQLNIVSERSLTADEQGQTADAVRAALAYPFNVVFVRVDEIPRGPTGKFEEFMSQIDGLALTHNPRHER